MDGYEVVTSDDKELGDVVGRIGDSLIVEHGLLRKKKHAVPLAFASTDEDERDRAHDALEGDDRGVAARSTTTASTRRRSRSTTGSPRREDAPATEGYGELEPDEPAITLRPAGAERRPDHARGGAGADPRGPVPGEGPLDRDESPGVTGGDRFRDAER